MKISIFEKWYSLWVNYSERKDCLWVFEITKEQKTKLEKWADYSINWETFEIIETEEYLEKIEAENKQEETNQAYKKFNNSLEFINSKYTQVEKDSFEIKRQEAEKVLNDENYTSSFLTALCIEWETQSELANKIIDNSNAYQTLYAGAEKQLKEDLKTIEEKYETENTWE